MILFTLRCAEQHEFEAWFRDNAAYEAQAAAGDIACPVCGDHGMSKAPMAPRVARGHAAPAADEAAALREEGVAVLALPWVGDSN